MSQTIQAIETRYKGYRFRSRLEEIGIAHSEANRRSLLEKRKERLGW